jgi:hypothetical protein
MNIFNGQMNNLKKKVLLWNLNLTKVHDQTVSISAVLHHTFCNPSMIDPCLFDNTQSKKCAEPAQYFEKKSMESAHYVLKSSVMPYMY